MSHTGNPRHPNNPPSDPPSEPTGAVAKDSLANESIARGGGFSENENPEVLGVKGYQSTLNTTDNTNADVLPPASSGAAREKQEIKDLGASEQGSAGGTKYPDSAAGQDFDGTHSDQGYRGGSGDASLHAGNVSLLSGGNPGGIGRTGDGQRAKAEAAASGGNESHGARPYVESAPNYVSDTAGGDARSDGTYQPKGKNLVEGGDIPENVKTFTGDVGGPHDPGRLAEREFAKTDADASGGIGNREYGNLAKGGDGTQYDALNPRERA